MKRVLAFLAGVLLGSLALVPLSAQPGPLAAQIQLALRNFTANPTPFTAPVLFADGTMGAPSIAFASTPTSGFFNNAGVWNLSILGTNTYIFGSATFQTNTQITTNGNLTIPQLSAIQWANNGGNGTLHLNGGTTGIFEFTNGAARKLNLQVTTTPTCPTNCGTSPTIAGVDSSFDVTMGATGAPASGWVVNFGGTWPAAPQCNVTMALTSMVVGKQAIAVVTAVGTMTVTTNGTAPANSDKYHVTCTAGT